MIKAHDLAFDVAQQHALAQLLAHGRELIVNMLVFENQADVVQQPGEKGLFEPRDLAAAGDQPGA